MDVFFSASDYRSYAWTLARQAERHGLAIWAYCLMPNHIHMIAIPSCRQGLSLPFGRAHRRYAEEINQREGWSGHLWQERFGSCVMDEPHLLAAIRYVLLNPVRAGLTRTAEAWPYSSARAHVLGSPDLLIDPRPVADRIDDWRAYLNAEETEVEDELIRKHSRLGRPLGSDAFIEGLEKRTGRSLRPRPRGRPKNIK